MAEYSKVGPWVNGGAPALSAANLDTLETQYELIKSEDLTFAGVKSFSGTLLIAADIQHIGDVNTKITFTADAINLQTGGASRVDLSNTGVRLGAANARVTTILDEDAMGSDSATALATQQSIKAYVASQVGAMEGTVALFQANAASGTMAAPQLINDNNTTTTATADAINEYAEVDYGMVVSINQYRQFGRITNDGDGVWKLQYYDLSAHAWVDWVTGIATRVTADWGGWDSSGGEVITNKIRLVCTAVDTQANFSYIEELEVKYA